MCIRDSIKPTAGEVLLDGKNINAKDYNTPSVRFEVGLVFQYPEYQLFEETVYKDIAYGPKNMGLTDDEIDSRVRSAAKFTGIAEELLDKSPFELSGGQKRRVAIAGVLAMDPKILVLDEPAAGLDPRGRNEILSGLVAYRKSRGNSPVSYTHLDVYKRQSKNCAFLRLMKLRNFQYRRKTCEAKRSLSFTASPGVKRARKPSVYFFGTFFVRAKKVRRRSAAAILANKQAKITNLILRENKQMCIRDRYSRSLQKGFLPCGRQKTPATECLRNRCCTRFCIHILQTPAESTAQTVITAKYFRRKIFSTTAATAIFRFQSLPMRAS